MIAAALRVLARPKSMPIVLPAKFRFGRDSIHDSKRVDHDRPVIRSVDGAVHPSATAVPRYRKRGDDRWFVRMGDTKPAEAMRDKSRGVGERCR